MASVRPISRSGWSERKAPELADFEQMASEVLAGLPDDVLLRCGHIQISLADYAPDDVLDALSIEDPHDLLGLFEGQGLAQGGDIEWSGQMPNRIWLFRRPILDYWAAMDDTLGEVVAHVLIHEIGHHFGLSDQDMERIEAATDR
ncbi:MAG: metallopeptidase family protein [Roseibium album]|uniref:Possibl zinc metallo-peptidase n=1 Tax=Roseibium album TaxID=311410 RepID=A0A0M6Z8H9_9HYPH|nr:metallopeptidase family protein [Roseibium album]MBG6144057.1 putative Zn-dependent protease with MMP-like domain [Labrenzia sp. EL_142]MBG6157471.1 putative Zn-dependent protease with MMP-like domain [Labrenzia sp. EL_162]MBG6162902.1 putative Zn-dependent protease with MMP-like domain [Labrenzia sp. EL_195]MBG6174704.1 putative Zn-dependent protease with MMP-like domain [Labrenzia sp. EL_132]MBG6196135.1 putative Zn-dependent protease with MMP-like domain [Labrenzia sp. EL_159]MBG6201563